MIFPDKKILYLNDILLAILLAHSVYRDIQLESEYPGDLRNRVVGARLQKDGKLPYHFHWHEGEGIRYYDGEENAWILDITREKKNPAESDINKITASPFFHELMYPICDLPQRTISRIWFWGQYLLLASMVGMISGLTNDKRKKWLLLNAGILFTATEAWKSLIFAGQIYLIEGFLICCILTALVKNKKYLIIFGGLCAAIFVLTRPIAIVIFIPFLFTYRKYLTFLSYAFGGLIIYLIFIFINPKETALYKDYLSGMKMQVQVHQDANDSIPPLRAWKAPRFSNIEGFDISGSERTADRNPVKVYSENGNFYELYYKIFHRKLPLVILNAGLVFTVVALSLLFFLNQRIHSRQTIQVLLFSFTLYMVVEFFSPVLRHQYNTVQWFPLVLAGFLIVPDWKNGVFVLLVLGLLLNICNFAWIPVRHTIGELCWLSALLTIIFSSRYNKTEWKELS